MTGPHAVVVPYAKAIADLIPEGLALRIRRDVGNLMAAISAATLVHAAQRQRDDQGRIIAELNDYKLACAAFGRDMAALHDLHQSENLARVIEVVKAMIAENKATPSGAAQGLPPPAGGVKVTARSLSSRLGISSPDTARRRLIQAVDAGILVEVPRADGRPYMPREPRCYALGQLATKVAGNVFPHPDDVAARWQSEQAQPPS
jgi:hypothetical protein